VCVCVSLCMCVFVYVALLPIAFIVAWIDVDSTGSRCSICLNNRTRRKKEDDFDFFTEHTLYSAPDKDTV
jgi:hypothetical protein